MRRAHGEWKEWFWPYVRGVLPYPEKQLSGEFP
jgi:hypothetical protein